MDMLKSQRESKINIANNLLSYNIIYIYNYIHLLPVIPTQYMHIFSKFRIPTVINKGRYLSSNLTYKGLQGNNSAVLHTSFVTCLMIIDGLRTHAEQ